MSQCATAKVALKAFELAAAYFQIRKGTKETNDN